jgi:hypothetical protein
MKLRFHSRAGNLVPLPGGHRTGSHPRYIGRTYDPETRAFKATDEPLEIDSKKHQRLAMRLKKLCRRDGSLLPADKETAEFCDVPFVKPTRQADGEWGLAPTSPGPGPKRARRATSEEVTNG